MLFDWRSKEEQQQQNQQHFQVQSILQHELNPETHALIFLQVRLEGRSLRAAALASKKAAQLRLMTHATTSSSSSNSIGSSKVSSSSSTISGGGVAVVQKLGTAAAAEDDGRCWESNGPNPMAAAARRAEGLRCAQQMVWILGTIVIAFHDIVH